MALVSFESEGTIAGRRRRPASNPITRLSDYHGPGAYWTLPGLRRDPQLNGHWAVNKFTTRGERE